MTIDTPEFRDLISRVWQAIDIDARDERIRPLIAYIDRRTAGPVQSAAPEAETAPSCWCHACNKDVTVGGWPYSMTTMIVCPTCGNKRCPKATDHALECTGSNEPGQAGSVYAAAPVGQSAGKEGANG